MNSYLDNTNFRAIESVFSMFTNQSKYFCLTSGWIHVLFSEQCSHSFVGSSRCRIFWFDELNNIVSIEQDALSID